MCPATTPTRPPQAVSVLPPGPFLRAITPSQAHAWPAGLRVQTPSSVRKKSTTTGRAARRRRARACRHQAPSCPMPRRKDSTRARTFG